MLGGRAPKAVRLAGRVTVNDEPFTKATRRRIGFVLQVGGGLYFGGGGLVWGGGGRLCMLWVGGGGMQQDRPDGRCVHPSPVNPPLPHPHDWHVNPPPPLRPFSIPPCPLPHSPSLPQDDVLYEDLTVHETLSYAALLRLPRELSRAQKLERVEQVIDALGVRKSKNTIIGE